MKNRLSVIKRSFILCLSVIAVAALNVTAFAKEESAKKTYDFSDFIDSASFISTGSWEVIDGKFNEKSGSAENYSCYSYYFKDVVVEWTMSIENDSANAYAGIAVRKQRPQDNAGKSGYNLKVFGDGSIALTNEAVSPAVKLADLPAGTIADVTRSNGYKLVVSSTTYSLYVNGGAEYVFSVQDDYYTIGGFSLISANSAAWFDDLSVEGAELGSMSDLSGASGVGGDNGGDERYGDIDKGSADSDFNEKIGDITDENIDDDWDFGEVTDNKPHNAVSTNGGCSGNIGFGSVGIILSLSAIIAIIAKRRNENEI